MVLVVCGICAGDAGAVPAVVDYIVDGDTFAGRVNLDDDIQITVRVRLMGIDTPELSGNCDKEIDMAVRARDRLAELLPIGSVVELRDVKDDKYLGRIDARVYNADGRDVVQVLLDGGFGRPYDGGRRTSWCE